MHSSTAWLLALATLVIAAPLVTWWALRPVKRQEAALPTQWSLSPRPVFSADERLAYRQLREALPHHVVLAKLPLVRFCQPDDPTTVREWFNLLGAIHVTFAVCSPTGRVLAAVDIESNRPASRRVQQIKTRVLEVCRIRYLRCAPHLLPSASELQLLVPQPTLAVRPQVWSRRGTPAAHDGAVVPGVGERAALWQDSTFMQDSFFGMDSSLADAGPNSVFGSSQFGAWPASRPMRADFAPSRLPGEFAPDPAGRGPTRH